MRANMYMSKCVHDQELTGSFLSMYVHLHASTLCACKKTLSLWRFFCFFSSLLSLSWVYHGGLPWQPQKWPVRTLGNVDVQIMTC